MLSKACKQLTKKDIQKVLVTKFKTEPMLHQMQSLAFCIDRDSVYFAHGIGTGKSLTSLYAHEYVWKSKKTLVVTNNSVVSSFEEQVYEHTDRTPIILKGTKKKRQSLADKNAKFFMINYEGLFSLFSSKDRAGKFRLDYSLIKRFNFDGLVFDEIQRLTNIRARQTKVAYAIARHASKRVGMSGTPIDKDLIQLFAPYYVLTDNETFGGNYYSFLNKYFIKGKWDYTIKHGARKEILECLRPSTIRFARSACGDLPELVCQRIDVDITPEQIAATKKALMGIQIDDKDNNITIKNKTAKLQQIPGGFVYTADGESVRIKNNKEDALKELLIQMEGKVIVFHEYKEEGRIIESICKKMGIGYASLRSDIKNKEENRTKFLTNPKCMVFICNSKAGGTGMNGAQDVCSNIIFYSPNWLSTLRDQCIGRVFRTGQGQKCLVVSLVCTKSIDERKMNVMAGREQEINSMLDFINNFEK